MKYHEDNRKWNRNGDSCKNEFEKLAFGKKPTGASETPLNVLRAKEIKYKMLAKEMIGCIEESDSEFEGHSDEDDNLDPVSFSNSLATDKLLVDSGKVRRPKTKKYK